MRSIVIAQILGKAISRYQLLGQMDLSLYKETSCMIVLRAAFRWHMVVTDPQLPITSSVALLRPPIPGRYREDIGLEYV